MDAEDAPKPFPAPPLPERMLDLALLYAAAGKPVHPVDAKTKKPKLARDVGPDGKPINGTGGHKKASCDAEKVTAWWSKPNWAGAMVGMPTGEKIGAWALELDPADKDGKVFTTVEAQIKAIEAEIGVALPDTMRVRSPRGGEHWFFLGDEHGYPANDAGVTRNGKEFRGVDIRGQGGYIMCAGSRRSNGRMYEYSNYVPVATAPPELMDFARKRGRWAEGRTKQKERAEHSGREDSVRSNLDDLYINPYAKNYARAAFEREIEALRNTEPGRRNQAIHDCAHRLASFVKDGLLTEEEIREAIEEIVAGWDNVDKSRDTMERGIEFGKEHPRELPPHIEEAAPHTAAGGSKLTIKDFYALLTTTQFIFAPSGDLWPKTSVNSQVPPVKAGGKTISAGDWVRDHQAVAQLTWMPGEPQVIQNKLISEGGWRDHEGVSVFNVYKPAQLKSGNANNAGLWIEHVHLVFPDEAEHIILWCAQRVQKPQIKINHSLVFGGTTGIGKDTLLEPVRYAVGPWNFHNINPEQALGSNNDFLKSVILRINEAADRGEFNRYALYSRLKPWQAAPPEGIRINEKHIKQYVVPNVTGIIITTNEKSALYLPQEDRRHLVAWSPKTKDDFPDAYWNKLWGFYERGGVNDVAAYLQTLDISGFDPKKPPLKTAAFWEICDAGRVAEDAELADVLDALENPDAVTLSQIMLKAPADFQAWLSDRKNSVKIRLRMSTCGYTPERNEKDTQSGLWIVKGKRLVVYAKNALSPPQRKAAVNKLLYSN